ncbi:MAG: hypothetical protein R3345_01730 [Fulvivirga sp.]|nr:hypothetical protein [Fulvivirga sp.]
MENNLNYKGIEKYAHELAGKILSEKQQESFSGNEILALTPIKQINLFIVKNLFTTWQKEAEQLKSPYFDYSHAQVQQALTSFMNVLSKHIAIKPDDLRPLLQKAIRETLLLIFSPYDFYMHQFAENEKIELDQLKQTTKYIKINKNIPEAVNQALEKENANLIDHDKMVPVLNQVFENTDASPEDVEGYLKQFDALLPLDQNMIYGDEKHPSDTASEEKEESSASLNDQFEGVNKILNDELAGNQPKGSIADVHKNQKIHNIQEHLTINQRFMFVRTLFEGDEEAFQKTIDKIEHMDDRSKAMDYIEAKYPNWDKESEEVEEFMEIISKRLA